jgi:hypothetical protein
MNTNREMPIGIQDFEKLRKGNYVYVNKTQYVYELGRKDRPYFLGRPHRFGKSLFLSTLKAYFEGKKELFEGLSIAELEKDCIQYPVIYLDFNKSEYGDVYAADHRSLVKIGVEFSQKEKGIKRWVTQ